MDTYFADPTLDSDDKITAQINAISNNIIIDTLLKTVSGLFAVLNDKRQLIAVNNSFLDFLGINDLQDITGYKLGEVVSCTYAHDMPHGCGTTLHCQSCGAAIAMASTLYNHKNFESKCIVKRTSENNLDTDLMFNLKSSYFNYQDMDFILIFLQDITRQQDLANLERVFFHDINNILTSLAVAVDLANHKEEVDDMLKLITKTSMRLQKEVEMQQCLSTQYSSDYQLKVENTSTNSIIQELQKMIALHQCSDEKTLVILGSVIDYEFKTDVSLVLRVLTNMAINAFEAAKSGEKVKLWFEYEEDDAITFFIHNTQEIPMKESLRVFQRNYSTKAESGRGLGTYSMRLFGEKILGGKVDFTTSKNDGTTFIFKIPLTYPEVD